MIHESRTLSSRTVAADDHDEPAWFAGAVDRLLQPIKDDLNTIKRDVRDLRTGLGKVRRISAITYNEACGTGDNIGLEVVPFANGEDPTEPPHNLPPLTSYQAVHDLDAAQRDAYYRGYELPRHTRDPEERIELIIVAIGGIST
ncbi:hypothetical protein BD779DRAFT_1576997 [Infundibulicybe gibba]|nr:hypothetical protein BD779DRAFT_1576997 [Infundibulicybe gibba]